jgi:hypothetical protein
VSDAPAPSKGLRAVVIKVVIALLLGAFGVLLPMPTFVDEKAMATETRRPAAGQQAPESTTTVTAPPQDDAPGDAPAVEGSGTTEPGEAPESTTAPVTDPTAEEVPPDEHEGDAVPPDGDGRVRVGEDTREFSLIGVTLADVPEQDVYVRTATDDGGWGPWEELHMETEGEPTLEPVPGAPVVEEPDETAPGVHSDPLWVGEASRYELDLPIEAAEDAQVHLVYETTRRVAVAETSEAGADPGAPAIRSRASWGARPPKVTPTIASSFQTSVVHHSAGTNNYSSAQVPAVLRGVQAYHMDANGWNDIGYNFAVDRFGRIWEARAGGITRAVVGGHARGFNTGSTGVVVLGNYETATPSAAVITAVSGLLAWKFAVHDTDPRTTAAYRAGAGSPVYPPGTIVPMNRIAGHRDVGQTACPGINLYRQLPTIRSRVAQSYPRLAAPGLALVGNFSHGAADDVFLRQPGVLRDSLLVGQSNRTFREVATFNVQETRYRPLVGDFDGNGWDDIFWYGPGDVRDSLWLSRGNGSFAIAAVNVSGLYNPVVGDFDGDGADDILWYAPGAVRDSLWLATGGGRFRPVAVGQVNGSYRPVAGDFDGDGDDDVFWHAPGPAVDRLWVARNGRFTSVMPRQVNGSYRPAAGDLDGDGDDDIFWYAPGSPPERAWRSQDLQFSSVSVPSVQRSYPYVRIGDFDGDGRDEALFYASPGRDSIWWHATAGSFFGRPAVTSPPLR